MCRHVGDLLSLRGRQELEERMLKQECPNCNKMIFVKSRKCKYCGIKILRERDFDFVLNVEEGIIDESRRNNRNRLS